MGNYIIIASAALIVLFGLIKKIAVFDTFLEGAKEGLQTAFGIMPAVTALTLCVSMIKASGCLDAVGQLISPLINAVHIPVETVPLMLIRPVSGSGALTVVQNIFSESGPDSYAGKVASVMMGSTETTFYTIAVYFGSVGIKKTGYTIPAALTADLAGMIFAALTVTFFM
ncbi:MAG: spore maturation protein [Acutalibacteraceae bacterium]|nr:spore maturation protein [Bacillota bacterium]